MAAQSSDFLTVRDERRHGRHRSRSGGYVDFLAEQEKFERQKHDMAMKRYHDLKRTPNAPTQPASSDTLSVPYSNPDIMLHRRVRSNEEMGEMKEPAREMKEAEPERAYKVREVKPSYDLSSDTTLPTQLPVRVNTWKPQTRPKIKVEITQDDPPPFATEKVTPRRCPAHTPAASASPRSPTAVPQLQYQFALLEVKFSQIEAMCVPHMHVEAVNPRDLTFAKIAEKVKSLAFQLRMWGQIANIDRLVKIDSKRRDVVEQVSHTLDRLAARVTELSDACAKAKPKDLKILPMSEVDEEGQEEMYEHRCGYGDSDSENDVAESLGFVIHSHLHGIQTNLHTLGRLTRPLQEASPDFMDEAVAVEDLIEEVDKFFGSEQALDRFSIDERFAGRKALEEARYAGGSRSGSIYQ